MRRTVFTLVAITVLAAGCSVSEGLIEAGPVPSAPSPSSRGPGTSSPPASGPGASTLAWTPCGQYECAKLSVPLDHDQPGGRQISIALNRRRATDTTQRIGSLLVNPGGPGASGVDAMPDIVDRISTEVKARFDIVGFDPRGTGESSPVSCLPKAELDSYFAADPTPDDEAEKAQLVESTRKFVAGCQQRSGDLLPHVGTEDAVRDMDLIRAAVGDEKLSYLGFSYGTSLGATYAELFPTRIRALVLDAAVDPSLDTPALNKVQGAGFDAALDAFVADCAAKATSCAWKPAGGPSKEAFLALSQRIDARPVTAGGRRAGPSEFLLGSAALLYSQTTWPVLGRALAQAEAGTGTLVLLGFDSLVNRNPDGSYGNDQEANAAINCLDNPAPKDLAVYEKAAADAARTAPAFGPAIAWSGLVCALWPVPATGRAEPLKVSGAPPILVIGTTNDPATPFVWSEAMAAQIPGSRLLRHEGEGHTAYGEDSCTTRIADGYLLNLSLPPGRLTC